MPSADTKSPTAATAKSNKRKAIDARKLITVTHGSAMPKSVGAATIFALKTQFAGMGNVFAEQTQSKTNQKSFFKRQTILV